MREQLAAKPQSGSHPSSPVALLHQTFPFAESPQCPQRLPGIANDHCSMKRRKQIVDTYNEAFSDLSGITLPRPYYHANPCWHLYVIRIEENTVGCSRKAFFDALVAENIHPQVHYFPVHLHPYYRSLGHYAGECPAAEYAYSQIMSLPLYPAMTDKDIDDVIEAVRKIYFYYNRKDDK